MPRVMYQDRFIELSSLQRKLHDEISMERDEIKEKLDSVSPSASKEQLEEYEKLEALYQGLTTQLIEVCDTPELLALSDSPLVRKRLKGVKKFTSPKLKELKDIVAEFVEADHKIVIFTMFERMLQLIKTELESIEDIGIACLYGSMSQGCNQPIGQPCNMCTEYAVCNSRRKSQWRFRNENRCQVFLTTDAGKEGLNLQNAKALINFDLPWDPTVLDQRNGRIRRVGATHSNVLVINLVARDSIEESILQKHAKSRDIIDTVVEKSEAERDAIKRLTQQASEITREV